MQHEIIFANSAALRPPAGHYSHTCTAAGLVFVSGQLPIDLDGKPLIGAVVIFGLQQVLLDFVTLSTLILGVLLIVIVLIAPNGLTGICGMVVALLPRSGRAAGSLSRR